MTHSASRKCLRCRSTTMGRSWAYRCRRRGSETWSRCGSGCRPEIDVERLTLRVVRDAEPFWVDAVADGAAGADGDRFFVAEVPVANPVTGYRILVDRGAAESSWLNGTGDHHRDVTDQHDFRLTVYEPGPDWAMDAVVYQIFPDRFASSGTKPLPEWAVERAGTTRSSTSVVTRRDNSSAAIWTASQRISTHVQALGADTVYLTPIFPARSNHRYDASSFAIVDPAARRRRRAGPTCRRRTRTRHAADRRPDVEPLGLQPRMVQGRGLRPGGAGARLLLRQRRRHATCPGSGTPACPSSTWPRARCARSCSAPAIRWSRAGFVHPTSSTAGGSTWPT